MPEKQEPSPQNMQPQTGVPVVDPQLIAAMYGMAQEDEIDLSAYWRTIKKRWKLIASVMLAAAIISAGISLLLPNIYQAQILMAPVNADQSSNGSGSGLSSSLGGRFGGLASLAGFGLGSTSSTEQNLAVLKSRAFLWGFVRDNKLMPILFAKDWKKDDSKGHPNLWDAYRLLTGKVLSVSTDQDSGLVTVAVDWTNPTIAADWANRLVARLNDYLRKQAIARSEANLKYLNEALQKTSVADVRQAIFTLIAQEQKKAMIANAQKQYAFQVLDAAAPPDRKVKPRRSIIVLATTFIAGFLALLFVIIRERISQTDSQDLLDRD